jgi:hypothetical protein
MEANDTERSYGCCNAKTRNGGHCWKLPVNGTGRCRLHGGASTGPKDTSYLEDNDHAVGNDGGAPPLNRNAEIHGAFTDLEKLEARLDEEGQADLADRMADLCEHSRDARPELGEKRRKRLAKEYVLLQHKWIRATADTFERGVGLTREKTFETPDGEVTAEVASLNPTVTEGLRLSGRKRRIGNVLGLWEHTRGDA